MLCLTKTWMRWVRVLAVLGLLALSGIGCTAGNAQKELTELRSALATVESKADTAQGTANEALALVKQVSTVDESPEAKRVLLASGIALTYEYEGKQERIMYPVDAVFVYPSYTRFRNAWENRPEIVVELAWTAGTEEGTWQLLFADQILIAGDPEVKLSDTGLSHWHEYLVYTQVGIPVDTEPDLSSVVVDQGAQQLIGAQQKADNVSVELLGEHDGEDRPYVQLLLTEEGDGQETHTLVTILEPLFALSIDPLPPPPDDLDDAGQQQCSNCVWGLCVLVCWWYGG